MFYACNNCFKVHGGVENEDYYPTAAISSASAAFCTGTPSTDFDDLVMLNTGSATASGTDLFPSNTAVSDYFTGTLETQGAQITGSATLAIYTGGYSDSTSTDNNLIPSVTTGLASGATGTSTTGSGTASQASSTKSTGSSNSASSSSSGTSASATANAAVDLKGMGGMLSVVAAAVGVICAL